MALGTEKTGRIVWHDLFTADRTRAMAFYQSVAGWCYQRERAEHFTWGEGAQDYVLALLEDEAGAGMVDAPTDAESGWVAYVEVSDVDAAAALADRLGGAVVRAPFDVPGVGRNALITDPNGALIGLSVSWHSFPVPQRQFGPDIYVSDHGAFPKTFYKQLFDWHMAKGGTQPRVINASDEEVGRIVTALTRPGAPACWVPGVRVADQQVSLKRASEMGSPRVVSAAPDATGDQDMLLRDPDNALISLF